MLDSFFQFLPLPADRYAGVYDIPLVALSYVVAVFASYIALDMAGRLRDKNNTPRSSLLWLLGGAIAMGSGIWSMHFIGMLSFRIPGLTLEYDFFWTAISLIVAILASGFALYLLKKSIINVVHLAAGGIILGIGIASMHYTGMEGMMITLNVRYLPGLFLLSILVAMLASEAAIMLALKSNRVILRLRNRIKFGSAIIMGIAICGMHYTGMAASVFTPLCTAAITTPGVKALDPTVISMAIASVTLMILSIAYFASNYKEAMNQQQFEQARQLGMAEISTSVLHNVGNVLNSVNVSANTLAEKMDSPEQNSLNKLSALLNEHKNDLPDFLTKDSRGMKVLDYISNLAEYQHAEQIKMSDEIKIILKNIASIRDIISAQQTLSKTKEMDYITSIEELVDEALLITGLNLNSEIKIEKHYQGIPPALTDKVKLLQVLVNVLSNAKEAVSHSIKEAKLISVTVSKKNNTIHITIKDNGIGISAENLSKIFYHGFTTKETGHGFGLHTSSLVMRDFGGEIQVNSDGPEKGATFTLNLPYREPR